MTFLTGSNLNLTVVVVTMLICAMARAEDAPAAEAEKPFELMSPPWEWETATHEYLGLRPKMEAHGITLDANVTADLAKNLRGGINTEGYNFGHLLNVTLVLDAEKLGLWKGGTIFANFQNQNGQFATADAGDIQVVDNIDADGRTQLAELWVGQKLFDDRITIKVGKIDSNAEFNTTPFSGDFIHSTPGESPTMLGMPAYPDPATGGQIFFDIENFYLGAGVFDGATQEGIATGDKGPATLFGKPAALYLLAEGGPIWKLKQGTLPGRLGVGVWHHTGSFDRFDGGTEHGTSGFYVLADQTLFHEDPAHADDEQGLGVFLRYGWADPDISRIEHSISSGVAWTGAIPSRDHDVFGLGVHCAVLTHEDGAGLDKPSETSIELFYKAQIFPWLVIQPDVQYIFNPGGVSGREDSLVGILRIIVNL